MALKWPASVPRPYVRFLQTHVRREFLRGAGGKSIELENPVWANERAYTAQAPTFRYGRKATKRRISYTAHLRRQIVMANTVSIDRFTPDCGNAIFCVRFSVRLVRCPTRSRIGQSGG